MSDPATSASGTPLPSPKRRGVPDALLRELAERHGTPLYVYRSEVIEHRVRLLRPEDENGDTSARFDVVRYAQKANSNLAILRLMKSLGTAVDSASAGEARRALAAGFSDDEIELTTDLFDRDALELLRERPIHVNVGSADMLDQLAAVRPGATVTLRVNPGFGHGHDRKVSTGGAGSKHGIWHGQIAHEVARARSLGLEVTGIHTHIGSGSDYDNLSRIRHALVDAALEVGGSLEKVSAGGGLPIPYRETEEPFDVTGYTAAMVATRGEISERLGRRVRLEVEPGRFLVAEAGLLLAEVRATKSNGGLDYLLVDAGFHTLARPALYGAYHHISVLGRDDHDLVPQVVAGPLCETGDMFTQTRNGEPAPRPLPRTEVGDLLVVHDAGAYAASMASNYNSRPLPAEVLLHPEGGGWREELVRRRQSFEQMIANELPERKES